MNSILDLFLGDPVLDRRERVVRRDFGIKNAVAICLSVYALSLFFSKNKILSGKKKKGKMKGGDGPPGTSVPPNDNIGLGILIAFIVGVICYVIYGFGVLIVSCWNGRC